MNVPVRIRDKLTDYVNCTAGVRQRDWCSPIFSFSFLFINELPLQVIDNGRRVACLMVDAFGVFIVLLADDVILMPETVVGLQTRLNSLQHAVSELKLKVNMNKN